MTREHRFWILLLDLAATWWMTGLIWLVHVVHYPLFEKVGSTEFTAYHQFHTQMITFVVFPAMVIELMCSVLLIWVRPRGASAWSAWLGLACVLVAWGVTGVCSVPEHERLAQGWNEAAFGRLLETNWIRVTAWTVHGCCLLLMVQGVLDADTRELGGHSKG